MSDVDGANADAIGSVDRSAFWHSAAEPEILGKMAVQFGTPTHVLDMNRLAANYRKFKSEFEKGGLDCAILYSIKTNYLPNLVSALKEQGCGADVVSGYEMELALKLEFPGAQITFNGPHKTAAELARALDAGVFINLDSADEAVRLNKIAEDRGRPVDVGLRLNPGIAIYRGADPTYNEMAGRAAIQSKFGYTVDDGAAAAAGEISRLSHLRITGFHCHLGSQITDADAFAQALERIFAFASQFSEGDPVERINIGGGFGVGGIRRERRGPLRTLMAFYGCDNLDAQNEGFALQDFARTVSSLRAQYGLNGTQFYCEPGRAIVSDAMALLATVSSVKETGGVRWVILDAGLNLMPTIAMHEDHGIREVEPSGAPKSLFRVGGPLCYEGDVLAMGKLLSDDIAEGDLVLIENSGAYTVSRGTNFIRPRAAVVALDGTEFSLCWRREEFADVFSFSVPREQPPEQPFVANDPDYANLRQV